MLNRLYHIICKEFYAIFQDKKTRNQLFIMPILFLFLFSYAMSMEVKNSSLAVLNEDAGDMGSKLVSMFMAGPTYSKVFSLKGNAEIRNVIDTQKAIMVLQIPKDFSSSILSGQHVEIQTILDGRKSNASQIVNGYAVLVVNDFMNTLRNNYGLNTSSMNIELRHLYNPNVESLWFDMPALLMMLTQMIVLIITSLSVAKERELGTFEQLLVSPLTPVEIAIGKSVPGICIGMAEAAAIFIISVTWFKVPFTGSILLLAWSMFLYISAVSGIGLFLSAISSTQQQATTWMALVMLPSILLSGIIAPVENMPGILQSLSLINPSMHILKIVVGLYVKGLTYADISFEITCLSIIGAVCMLGAIWFFKKKVQ